MYKKNIRKCIIPNYIPHRITKKVRFDDWFNEYNTHLINLFDIIRNIINFRYPDSNISDNSFQDFCILVYNSSSKFILKI
jgi:hypothetical protein